MNDTLLISLIAAYVALKIFDKNADEILYIISILLGVRGFMQARMIYMLPRRRKGSEQDGEGEHQESSKG